MTTALEYFKEISKYPRPSKHEEKIREFLISWAKTKGYLYTVDAIGNLVVKVPWVWISRANEVLILQGHMDMVCVKTSESSHDFSKDSIEIIEDGNYLRAKDTSLGADNGIGVALILSASEFENHPPLELVFTVDEEQGMSGALEFDFSKITGKRLINIDSENETEICISSAGGVGLTLEKILTTEHYDVPSYEISISGLIGWHSWVEIHEERWNAILLLSEFIATSSSILWLSSFKSWVASNVIPSSANAVVFSSNRESLELELSEFISKKRWVKNHQSIEYTISTTSKEQFWVKDGKTLLGFIVQSKNGVISMSSKIPRLVETSLNLGILSIDTNSSKVVYLMRSSDTNKLQSLFDEVETRFCDFGFTVSEKDRGYPGWEDSPDSPLVQLVVSEFQKIIGNSVKTVAIHAGLECGALVWGMGLGATALSIGPNMHEIHSTWEHLEIASTKKIEAILREILMKA